MHSPTVAVSITVKKKAEDMQEEVESSAVFTYNDVSKHKDSTHKQKTWKKDSILEEMTCAWKKF